LVQFTFTLSKTIGLQSLEVQPFIFFQKLEEFYKIKIQTELKKFKDNNLGKLLFYSKISENFELKKYPEFNLPKPLSSKLTKIRISVHPLAIESGRYCKPITPANKIIEFEY